MGHFIIKLNGYYLEWSTIVDAPTTFGMSREEFEIYYREEYGRSEMRNLPERLQRAGEKGSSARDYHTLDRLIAGNRAGPDEATLTRDEIYRAYCLMEPIRDGWKVPTVEDS